MTSFKIDSTCRNYKGQDIRQDVRNAVDEVNNLAYYGWFRLTHESTNAPRLLLDLFGTGTESARYHEAVDILARLVYFRCRDNFTIICDDQTIQLEPDWRDPADPRGYE